MPKWDIYRPEHGEDPNDCRSWDGRDAEHAVEKWAERDDADSADYSIVRGSEATVMVRMHGTNDPWEEWRVYGEAVPSYSAIKIHRPECQGGG